MGLGDHIEREDKLKQLPYKMILGKSRGYKIGQVGWVSSIHSKLGLGWGIKLLT